jgi:hypothetical protein
MSARPQKITLAECVSGVRAVLIYCSEYRCSHYIATINGPRDADISRMSRM